MIPLSAKGCVSNISLKFPDGWISGKRYDLSAFGSDLTKWNEIKCQVENKHATISLNGTRVYEVAYENPAGKIIGLLYLFYGCGSVEEVKLYDEAEQIVFEDNFSSSTSNAVAIRTNN